MSPRSAVLGFVLSLVLGAGGVGAEVFRNTPARPLLIMTTHAQTDYPPGVPFPPEENLSALFVFADRTLIHSFNHAPRDRRRRTPDLVARTRPSSGRGLERPDLRDGQRENRHASELSHRSGRAAVDADRGRARDPLVRASGTQEHVRDLARYGLRPGLRVRGDRAAERHQPGDRPGYGSRHVGVLFGAVTCGRPLLAADACAMIAGCAGRLRSPPRRGSTARSPSAPMRSMRTSTARRRTWSRLSSRPTSPTVGLASLRRSLAAFPRPFCSDARAAASSPRGGRSKAIARSRWWPPRCPAFG